MFLSGLIGECQEKAFGAKLGGLSAVFFFPLAAIDWVIYKVSFLNLFFTMSNMDNTRIRKGRSGNGSTSLVLLFFVNLTSMQIHIRIYLFAMNTPELSINHNSSLNIPFLHLLLAVPVSYEAI